MPDISALYPAPPQQNNAQNALISNPLSLIPALNTLQEMGLRQQQIPALAQQPAASLANTNIQNATALLQQQDAMRRMASTALAGQLGGLENPSEIDVHNGIANLKKFYPTIPGSAWNAASDVVLKEPRGIKFGIGLLLNSTLSPAEQSQRTEQVKPSTGQKESVPVPAANLAGRLPTSMEAGGQESALAMQADLRRSGQFPQEMFPWQQALSKMQDLKAKGYTFGPGSKGWQEMQSYAITLAPTIARWAGVNPEKVSDWAQVEKYLTQAMSNRAQNIGPKTDAGLATAISGSPNVNVSDLAGEPLIKAAIAMRRMEQDQTLENIKHGPAKYTEEVGKWATRQDPRAYGIDMMSPDQIVKLQRELKGEEKAKFNASLKSAIQNGIITRPAQ